MNIDEMVKAVQVLDQGVHSRLHLGRGAGWLGFEPLEPDDRERLSRAYTAAVTKYGESFAGRYGWAASFLPKRQRHF
jgi:hypothetical protein